MPTKTTTKAVKSNGANGKNDKVQTKATWAPEIMRLDALHAMMLGVTIPRDSPLYPYSLTPPRKRHQTNRCTLAEVAHALEITFGTQSVAATLLGITRSSVGEWVARHPELRKIIDKQEGQVLDLARNNVYKGVMEGDKVCSMFMLKTRDRENWSQTTQAVDKGSAIMPKHPEIDLSDVPDEDLVRLGNAIRETIRRDAARHSAVECRETECGEDSARVSETVVRTDRS